MENELLTLNKLTHITPRNYVKLSFFSNSHNYKQCGGVLAASWLLS